MWNEQSRIFNQKKVFRRLTRRCDSQLLHDVHLSSKLFQRTVNLNDIRVFL